MYACLAADSSIWPLDEANLVHVSAVSSSAQCRCAVRPLRSSDTPPQCPTSIYLGWKNSDDQVLWKTTTYFNRKKWLYPITVLPPVLHPCPIYLSAWRVITVKEERKHESGQRGRQRCCERAHDSCGYVRFKKKITCDKDEEKCDASGLGKSERLLLLTSSWPHLGTTVWIEPSVTVCFANCLRLMTPNLLASSLRVHQGVLLGQHNVFKASLENVLTWRSISTLESRLLHKSVLSME